MSQPDAYEQQLAKWLTDRGAMVPGINIGEMDFADLEDAKERAADKLQPGEDYCVHCGKGPVPIGELCLITRRDDPYIQPEADDEDEEGAADNRVRACPECWRENYGPEQAEADEDAKRGTRNAEQGASPEGEAP